MRNSALSRGDRTRERILDVAERLFGELGVANVSMRQIRITAEQRNERAVQYYFTDRRGLIQALGERHSPGILAIQERIVAGHGRRPSLRNLIDAWARPIPEYSTRGPSERSWTKILADLLADPQLSTDTVRDAQPTLAIELAIAIYDRLCKTLPPAIAGDRIWAAAQFTVHITATRARLVDEHAAARAPTPDADFVDNVVAMTYGALVARLPEH